MDINSVELKNFLIRESI